MRRLFVALVMLLPGEVIRRFAIIRGYGSETLAAFILALVLNLFLMAFVNWPYAFLFLAALGGGGGHCPQPSSGSPLSVQCPIGLGAA